MPAEAVLEEASELLDEVNALSRESQTQRLAELGDLLSNQARFAVQEIIG